MTKKEKEDILKIVKDIAMNKKVQWALTSILFLIILISSVDIRLNNLDNLVDQTTGLYTSNDLDSMYFYRIAETKLANNGELPLYDTLRAPARHVDWMTEILPDVMIYLYKIEKIFSPDITFNYSATISAPIIFGMILIAFFILCLLITKSKLTSLIASALLAYSSTFLFRSIAGFYDHDHLGVLAIILTLIVLVLTLRRFEKNWKETVIRGILLGFATSVVLVSWGGGITFLLVCLPVALLLYYLFNNKNQEKFIAFYALWIIVSVLFTPLLGNKMSIMYSRFFDSQGLAVLFVFGFALIDYILGKMKKKIKFINERNEKLYSFAVTVVFGIIGLLAIGKNPISLFKKAWATLIFPFFGEFGSKLETTVAENAQPYLVDFMSQMSNIVFIFFMLGLMGVAIHLSKEIKLLKHKIYFSGSAALVFFAILCSRISSNNLLNGENFVSQAIYFVGAILFLLGFAYIYSKEKFNISSELIILFSIALTTVINVRSATRSFFLIAPFVCLIAAYFLVTLWNSFKNAKDETYKYTVLAGSIISLGLLIFTLSGNPFANYSNGMIYITSTQATYIGSSSNFQWQNAMDWVRNNTEETEIFVHWWDYGYFIQTLANRPTVTDGGHAGGGVSTDHFIGRYVLTTPNPKTAFSFMKTWNVSYLLIDPSETGKYGAFSKIGSNDSWDRVSGGVVSGAASSQNDKETSTGVIRLYQLGSCVDQDIDYNNTFLPGITVTKTQSLSCKSAIGGIMLEQSTNQSAISFKQPIGAFLYNNKQYNIPIKNLYFEGKMMTFSSGIDAVAYVIPSVTQTSDGKITLDPTGGIVYLSPTVFKSLFGRLYVLNDYYKEYPTIQIADSEDSEAVKYFKQAWGINDDFIYFGGLQAPLKIWKVSYPLSTETHREFLNLQEDIDSGAYYMSGEMDKYF